MLSFERWMVFEKVVEPVRTRVKPDTTRLVACVLFHLAKGDVEAASMFTSKWRARQAELCETLRPGVRGWPFAFELERRLSGEEPSFELHPLEQRIIDEWESPEEALEEWLDQFIEDCLKDVGPYSLDFYLTPLGYHAVEMVRLAEGFEPLELDHPALIMPFEPYEVGWEPTDDPLYERVKSVTAQLREEQGIEVAAQPAAPVKSAARPRTSPSRAPVRTAPPKPRGPTPKLVGAIRRAHEVDPEDPWLALARDPSVAIVFDWKEYDARLVWMVEEVLETGELGGMEIETDEGLGLRLYYDEQQTEVFPGDERARTLSAIARLLPAEYRLMQLDRPELGDAYCYIGAREEEWAEAERIWGEGLRAALSPV